MVLEIGSPLATVPATLAVQPAVNVEPLPVFGPNVRSDPDRRAPGFSGGGGEFTGRLGNDGGIGAGGVAETEDALSSASSTAEAVKEFNENQSGQSTRLSILFDDASRQFVSRSVALESGEVIDQFPQEAALRRIAAVVAQLSERATSRIDVSV